jgi:hypothetical protein
MPDRSACGRALVTPLNYARRGELLLTALRKHRWVCVAPQPWHKALSEALAAFLEVLPALAAAVEKHDKECDD